LEYDFFGEIPVVDNEGGLVCIVDDEPINIKVLSSILEEDYNICVATSGSEALALIRERHPDIVLLDIVMPEMDGFEVCKALKSDDATADIPVVFITAMTDLGSESNAFEKGAEDFIAKPFSPSVVMARVARIIQNALYVEFLEGLLAQKSGDLDSLHEQIRGVLEQDL
jgi:putative two-component system response regulator